MLSFRDIWMQHEYKQSQHANRERMQKCMKRHRQRQRGSENVIPSCMVPWMYRGRSGKESVSRKSVSGNFWNQPAWAVVHRANVLAVRQETLSLAASSQKTDRRNYTPKTAVLLGRTVFIMCYHAALYAESQQREHMADRIRIMRILSSLYS